MEVQGKFKPKLRSEYSDAEKIKTFDDLHEFATDIFDYLKMNHWKSPPSWDPSASAYEKIMELLGEGVWGVINERR